MTRLFAMVLFCAPYCADAPLSFENSIGMRMIPVPAARFSMGNSESTPAAMGGPVHSPRGDWDERPVHDVTISKPFLLSESEVTAGQLRMFDPSFQPESDGAKPAAGLSWDKAAAFAAWLSKKENKSYRLPTEAEWEHACRLDERSLPGVRNLRRLPAEWVSDWYGEYAGEAETDPVGPRAGAGRVIRGGGLQLKPVQHGVSGANEYYSRCANRASMAPQYSGSLPVGVRLVLGPEAGSPARRVPPPFPQQAVLESTEIAATGPDMGKPYFRKRPLLPIPPENAPPEAIEAAGLPAGVMGHNHSAGLEVCANGDLLAILFSSQTSHTEYWPNVNFVITRLRFGSNEWDVPEMFYDFADMNEQASLLWRDGGELWHFSGGQGMEDAPMRIQRSSDHGASWSAVEFAHFPVKPGPHSPQPINSAWRSRTGTIYVASDAAGGESVLWASDDKGNTWRDTGGRTAGRHTTFVDRKDGSLLGLGGKNTNIEGYMPQSVSTDGGRTWQRSRTQFPALGSNQRPTLIRLASGRLFFASDYQNFEGKAPAGVGARGAFAALSDDDGATWKIKRLKAAAVHESHVIERAFGGAGWVKSPNTDPTLGYAVARQAPNGVIHVITSMNHPSLHFEFNEAWILDPDAVETGASRSVRDRSSRKETYSNGKVRAVFSGGVDDAGVFVLDGAQRFFHQDGSLQYEASYQAGRKIRSERLFGPEGRLIWSRVYGKDDTRVRSTYWPNGKLRCRSEWTGAAANGSAECWTPSGVAAGSFRFAGGELLR